jgi:hypothetical protein
MSILTLAATLMLLGPVTLESGKFTVTQDGRKVGTEQFTISARPGGGYIAEAKIQLVGDSTVQSSRMELDEKLIPISYVYTRGKGAIRLKITQPSIEYETESEGKKSTINLKFPENAAIVDNNFFSHYLLLLYKVGEAGGELPIFVPQDIQIGLAIVKAKGNNVYELNIGYVTMEATTDKNGKLIRLTAPESKVVVER